MKKQGTGNVTTVTSPTTGLVIGSESAIMIGILMAVFIVIGGIFYLKKRKTGYKYKPQNN